MKTTRVTARGRRVAHHHHGLAQRGEDHPLRVHLAVLMRDEDDRLVIVPVDAADWWIAANPDPWLEKLVPPGSIERALLQIDPASVRVTPRSPDGATV